MPFSEHHPNFAILRQTLAEHHAPIVFWIGAGVSRDAGLPTWRYLRAKMAEAALEELVTRSTEEADELEGQLNEAFNTNDLWQAFELIQGILGLPTYKAMICSHLGPSDTVAIPDLHNLIWENSSVRGVVTLNIDGLEGRSHRAKRANEVVDEFIGRDLRNHIPTLQARKPFIARLHGHHSDTSSWIFTKSDLSRQIKDEAYRTAISAIFSNFTVIFLGISADDLAVGGFLEAITQSGIDAGNHFWITDRSDRETREWTERAGILRIPYTVGTTETHTGVISSIFEAISNFFPRDTVAPTILYNDASTNIIPSLQELKSMPEDDIRRTLNSYAKHILDESAQQTDTRAYQDFLASYSPAIHQAWHISEHQGYNKFFGYTAVEKIYGGGIFLSVASSG